MMRKPFAFVINALHSYSAADKEITMYQLALFEEANFWTALPSILWVSLLIIILLVLYKPISELISQFIIRVRAGAPMRIGYVEFGAVQTEQAHTASSISSSSAPESAYSPESAHPAGEGMSPEAMDLNYARESFKEETRRIMLVHRLFRSTKQGQVYDVLIYLVPREGETLVAVSGVEYFFGRYWKNQIFQSYDRSRGFPILTSAYGTFLCCARVSFNDGYQQTLFRYIDFEMGAYAPVLVKKNEESK
jgi:hypothetical protein